MQNVLIAGGSGLIGKRLTQILLEEGYSVSILGRNKKEVSGSHISVYNWDPSKHIIPNAAIEKADHIINLAGASISKRWTKAYKEKIVSSRVEATSTIVEALDEGKHHVKTFINGSATGFYGYDRGEELYENSEAGNGFLGETCKSWEDEAFKLKSEGTRLVISRTGIVFGKEGGALKKMAMPIRFFVGSALGNGRQFVPWIHIDDLCYMFIHILRDQNAKGIYNVVAPNPATNKEITKAIAKQLHRPLILPPIPGFVLNIILGELYQSIVGSLKVSATKIEQEGFTFRFPDINGAINDLLIDKKFNA